MVALLTGSLGLVAYVFVGYPAVIAVWARLRPRPLMIDPQYTPAVSLLILAHNEEAVIAAKLRNTEQLEYPRERLEVIVVADGSDDATAEVARRFAGVQVLHEPERRGKLAAIKRGVQVASGEILLFSDANNDYAPEVLREIVRPFSDPSVGVVTGRKMIDDGSDRPLDQAEGLYWKYESQIKVWESAIGSVVGVTGEVLATRSTAFRPPAAGTLTEDFVQALSAAIDGWRVVYAPGARSVERASATIEDEMTRRARLATGRFQAIRSLMPGLLRTNPRLAWQVISHKALRPVVPWALILAAVSNGALVRQRSWARGLLAAQAVFYAAALAGRRDHASGRHRPLTYLPYYFCKMNFASLQGLRAYLGGHHSPSWTRVERG